MSKSWDSTILKKLKALVGKGLSTAEIGKRLGMSKNAIVGKLHRLGWNSKAPEVKSEPVQKKATAGKKMPLAKKTPIKPQTKKNAGAQKTVRGTSSRESKSKTVAPARVVKNVPPAKNVKPAKTASKKDAKTDIVATTRAKTNGGHAIAGKNVAVHQRIVQHALEMANLKPNQCRWPVGDPDSGNFHFCGQQVFVGKPYCYEHCRQAYQFTTPKKK